ncbi:hypothetical protein Pint_04276 [Pistacia integerrima]|uniref:Uncharacterized protein n=1 Tax=Pistacia integerrima TaxID=434235 RepID=A0ACC0Z2Z0_9ROSI|nr:hypothetical protein Pint_04276 [Pistacia integerrima]
MRHKMMIMIVISILSLCNFDYLDNMDVFRKFKDSHGNFKASLVGDVRGMLRLYEAAHLRVDGETILDEALAFTTTYLEPMATQFSSQLVVGVYFEPGYGLARRILTKVIAISSIIDEIYDAYGTIEELELFIIAIERWDISAIDQLPA